MKKLIGKTVCIFIFTIGYSYFLTEELVFTIAAFWKKERWPLITWLSPTWIVTTTNDFHIQYNHADQQDIAHTQTQA